MCPWCWSLRARFLFCFGFVTQFQTAIDTDVLEPVLRVSSGEGSDCHSMLKPVCWAVLEVSTAPSQSTASWGLSHLLLPQTRAPQQLTALTNICLFFLSLRHFIFALSFRLQMWKLLRSVPMKELPGQLHRGSGAAWNGSWVPPKVCSGLFHYEAFFGTWDFLELSVLLTCGYGLPVLFFRDDAWEGQAVGREASSF